MLFLAVLPLRYTVYLPFMWQHLIPALVLPMATGIAALGWRNVTDGAPPRSHGSVAAHCCAGHF